VTEDKQKKTSSNAIIFNIARSWNFSFLSCQKKKKSQKCVYDGYSKKVELMCTVAQQRLRFSMVKKKERRKEIKAD
jgi:hypothetical protein